MFHEVGSRLAPDGEDVALNGHLDVLRRHPGERGPDEEVIAVGHDVNRGGPRFDSIVVIGRRRAEPPPHPVHGLLHLP